MADSFDLGGTQTLAELSDVRASLEGINISADKVGKSLTRAFATAITSGKSFDQTLRAVGLNLSRLALNAGLQPLMQGATSLVGSAFSSLTGGGGGSVPVAPFAEGGVVARPTFFASGGGLGLMGERGAEAILPLARGPDGRLGLASSGQRESHGPVHVTINTPDAESFRRSHVQVSSALTRAVMRGRRGL